MVATLAEGIDDGLKVGTEVLDNRTPIVEQTIWLTDADDEEEVLDFGESLWPAAVVLAYL